MTPYDLYAIGNALVDTEYEVSDAELQATGGNLTHTAAPAGQTGNCMAPSSYRQRQVPNRLGRRPHGDLNVIPKPVQAPHQLALGQVPARDNYLDARRGAMAR
jgi:hypothetical protein